MNNQIKPTRRAARRDVDIIRSSRPGPDAVRSLSLPRLPRICADEYVNATLGNKSGYATYGLTIGDATYRAVTWAIVSTAAIVDVTETIGGRHYVTKDHLPDYLDQVRVVANGSKMQEMSMGELNVRNDFHAIDFGAFYSGFAYPGPGIYDSQALEDAFALGTQGLRSLSLELQLKAAFDPDTMQVEVMPHVVDIARFPGFVYTSERLNQTFNGAGKHTYKDLPIGDDIKDIWIQGAGIERLEMSVDGDLMFDMDRAQYDAWLISQGRDPSGLGDGWYIDFHAEGDARSLAALDRVGERKRDARIKINLYTSQELTPVEFLVTHADLFANIR